MIKKIHKKIQNFRTQGKIAPSGKYLVEHMLEKIPFHEDIHLLQLGFGTGVFTKKISEKLSAKSTLTIFEIDPNCRHYLIEHPQITYIEDSAENIGRYFPEGYFDHILSTLPFGSLPPPVTQNILSRIPRYLKKGGKFLQFQYIPLHRKKIEKSFQQKSKMSFVVRNIPSAFVYEVGTNKK